MSTHDPDFAPPAAPRGSPDEIGARICRALAQHTCACGVSWITAHRECDGGPTYRIYQTQGLPYPAAGAGRIAATRVTEVRVLAPYCFK